MVVYAKNIYDIVDLFYYPMKILSMAPFYKVTKENKIRVYKASSLGLKEYLYLGTVLSFILIMAAMRSVTFFLVPTISFADYFYGVIYWVVQLVNLGKVIELFFNNKNFLHCLDLIEKLDTLFSKLHNQFTIYKKINIFVICFLISIPFNTFVTMVPIWELIESIQVNGWGSLQTLTFIFQLFNLSPISIIRDLSMYLFMTFVVIILHRTTHLRQHISDIEKSKDNEAIKRSFILVAEMHNTLFHLTEKLNGTFGWSLIWNVSICFIELTAVSVSLKYSNLLKPHQAALELLSFIICTISILTVSYRIKIQINMLKKALSNLELPYYDKECYEILQLLLLQLNHEHIHLHCYHVYSMDMTVITIHVGITLALAMFFLQLQDVNN